VAAHLARRLDADLTLVAVVQVGPMAARPRPDAFRHFVDDIAADLGLQPALRVEIGRPAERLLAVAGELGSDLLVIGDTRRGPIGDALLGGTRAEITRHAPCPVMVVPAGAELPDLEHLLLGFDGSSASEAAASAVGRLAVRSGAAVTAMQAITGHGGADHPTGWRIYDAARRIVRRVHEAGGRQIEINVERRRGSPAAVLTDAAAQLEAAVVVVGVRHRSALRRLIRPDIGAQLVRSTRRPVVLAGGA
jgi:nucleotide-binding universal stress UspA family protein